MGLRIIVFVLEILTDVLCASVEQVSYTALVLANAHLLAASISSGTGKCVEPVARTLQAADNGHIGPAHQEAFQTWRGCQKLRESIFLPTLADTYGLCGCQWRLKILYR
jgi:hypothetical protein